MIPKPVLKLAYNSRKSGLFYYELKKTGVSTAAVVKAADHLLASLTNDQREKIQFPVNDPEWRNWANIHRFPREGVSLAENESGAAADCIARPKAGAFGKSRRNV